MRLELTRQQTTYSQNHQLPRLDLMKQQTTNSRNHQLPRLDLMKQQTTNSRNHQVPRLDLMSTRLQDQLRVMVLCPSKHFMVKGVHLHQKLQLPKIVVENVETAAKASS